MISANNARLLSKSEIGITMRGLSARVTNAAINKKYSVDVPLNTEVLRNPVLLQAIFEQLAESGYKVSMAEETQPSSFTIMWN